MTSAIIGAIVGVTIGVCVLLVAYAAGRGGDDG
jgi:hypothetical protein